MSETIAYYYDVLRGYYYRNLRYLKWQSRYYILPAYQKLWQRSPWRRQPWIEFGLNIHGAKYRQQRMAIAVAAGLAVLIGGLVIYDKTHQPSAAQRPSVSVIGQSQVVPSITNQPTTPPASTAASAPLLFGLGAQADGAMSQRLYRDAPVGMLSSWFNSPDDLRFMRGWQKTTVPQAYTANKAMHLIIWTGGEEKQLRTKFGPACGREYPFSASFESDMRELATIFKGHKDGPPLYVSMFTEFQTYPCLDNTWQGNEAYYRGLQERYRVAMRIFHEVAPNSQVSLTWGGWQAEWNDPAKGSGQALIPYFADVMRESDFQSFQAMDSRGNLRHIADMTRILGTYSKDGSKRVMVAHFKPDNGSQTTWSNDLTNIFTPQVVAQLKLNGLFAFSFMDEKNIDASDDAYEQARLVVRQYGGQ